MAAGVQYPWPSTAMHVGVSPAISACPSGSGAAGPEKTTVHMNAARGMSVKSLGLRCGKSEVSL
jgi:hypothetical protein